MPEQGILTLCVAIIGVSIPLILLKVSVALTHPGPVACIRCDADVPRTAQKCPNCGTIVPDQDQEL